MRGDAVAAGASRRTPWDRPACTASRHAARTGRSVVRYRAAAAAVNMAPGVIHSLPYPLLHTPASSPATCAISSIIQRMSVHAYSDCTTHRAYRPLLLRILTNAHRCVGQTFRWQHGAGAARILCYLFTLVAGMATYSTLRLTLRTHLLGHHARGMNMERVV